MSKKRQNKSTFTGYEVPTELTRVERLNNTRSGNPRYRLHTTDGMFITDDDAQACGKLVGDESGTVILRLEDNKVIGWKFPETATSQGAN